MTFICVFKQTLKTTFKNRLKNVVKNSWASQYKVHERVRKLDGEIEHVVKTYQERLPRSSRLHRTLVITGHSQRSTDRD